MYYYAHIDSDYLVYEVCALNEPTTDSSYIAITEAQYNDEGLIGMRYDPDYETFMEPIYWIGSTMEIYYKNTRRSLSGKLDEMDEAINALSNESTSMTLTLSASAWIEEGEAHKQTLEIAGLGENQNGVMGISKNATDAQFEQACKANMRLMGQGEGYVLIKALGDVPTVNIPVDIILY